MSGCTDDCDRQAAAQLLGPLHPDVTVCAHGRERRLDDVFPPVPMIGEVWENKDNGLLWRLHGNPGEPIDGMIAVIMKSRDQWHRVTVVPLDDPGIAAITALHDGTPLDDLTDPEYNAAEALIARLKGTS